MTHIAYYISSHGYGHAARQQAVIKDLVRQGAKVHVRTAAPQKFFSAAESYHEQRYDIGMIQQDALHFDIPASLNWYAEFHAAREKLIEDELAFVKKEKIQLIVSDMPPIAFDIAHRASIPSVACTHFTWDWIYAYYTEEYPQYQYLVDEIRESYMKATLALQMQIPIPHEFDMFPKVEPIPNLYNKITQSRESIRTTFDIPDGKRMGLLTVGGHTWGESDIRSLRDIDGWVFLVVMSAWDQVKDMPERFRVIPDGFPGHYNLIAAADLLIGKTGGSTVSEVIAHRTPMIYTTRNYWRESFLLTKSLKAYGVSQHIPMEAFIRGEWVYLVKEFMAKPHEFPDTALDGVQVTAQKIMKMVT